MWALTPHSRGALADSCKALLPAFQFTHIRALYPMFWAKSCQLVETVRPLASVAPSDDAAEFDFQDFGARITMDIIGSVPPLLRHPSH